MSAAAPGGRRRPRRAGCPFGHGTVPGRLAPAPFYRAATRGTVVR